MYVYKCMYTKKCMYTNSALIAKRLFKVGQSNIEHKIFRFRHGDIYIDIWGYQTWLFGDIYIDIWRYLHGKKNSPFNDILAR